jgi:type I restriction enzyme S subunit
VTSDLTALPVGWIGTSLGEVAAFEMGQAPPGSASNFSGQGTVFVKAGEFGKDYPVVREWTTAPLKYARAGDVLICVVGATAGKLNLGIDCAIGRSVAAIRPNGVVLQKIVYRQLQARVASMRAGSTGSAQGVISKEMLAELPIAIPPQREQQRIADKLDTVFARVDACRDRLARVAPLLKRFRQSVLANAMLGRLTEDWRNAKGMPWMTERRTLADLADVITGSTPSKKDASNFGDAVPFLKPSDLDQGYTVAKASEYLSLAGAELARMLPACTVLVTCIGATIGKTGLARVACTTNQQIIALVARPANALPAWLYFWCCSPAGQQSIITNSSATTLPILNKSRFSALEASVPLLVEQAEIVRRVETLFAFADRLEARLAQAQTAVDRLTPSLLAKAFRGELVPPDPADEPATELLKRLAHSRQAEAPKPRRRRAVATSALNP